MKKRAFTPFCSSVIDKLLASNRDTNKYCSAKNMRPYSQQAFELKMGIEAGVVTSSEVISWADETLSKHDYDDDLANISMASEASPKDLIILIGQVVDQRDDIQAMRNVMGRIYLSLIHI